jgi:tRNA (cytidine/uridine-2'-O-)-methyltransferase
VEIDGPVLACAACGFRFHFNPAVAAGIIVEDGRGRVLLLKRAHEPRRGAFGLPGGFVDAGETLEQAIEREAREETGLELEDVRLLGGWPNVYEWRGVGYPVLDLHFTARARPGARPAALDEVDALVWADPETIDPDTLAFPTTRAALARYLERRAPTGPRALHVALVFPEIHWNTGNAGRTCLAAGARLHLVRPLGFSLDEREVRRAGLDYWERVDPRVWPGWAEFETALPSLGEPFFASPDAERTLWDVPYPERTVLVFGPESVGFPPDVRERYRDRLVRLPMQDEALRSLNLSTVVGVLLYEVLRQWRRAGSRP